MQYPPFTKCCFGIWTDSSFRKESTAAPVLPFTSKTAKENAVVIEKEGVVSAVPEELFVPGTVFYLKRNADTQAGLGGQFFTLWKRHPGEHFQRIVLSNNLISDHKCDSHYYALRDVLKGLPGPTDEGIFRWMKTYCFMISSVLQQTNHTNYLLQNCTSLVKTLYVCMKHLYKEFVCSIVFSFITPLVLCNIWIKVVFGFLYSLGISFNRCLGENNCDFYLLSSTFFYFLIKSFVDFLVYQFPLFSCSPVFEL